MKKKKKGKGVQDQLEPKKGKEKNQAESNLSEREVDSIAVKQEEIAIAAR